MKQFFKNNGKLIVEESIKSFFTLVIAIVAVLFWENQKIRISISFEKKMEIITKERSDLMEYTDRFTESWNYIRQHVKENGNSDCLSGATYTAKYNILQRISDKTDLILGNSLIDDKGLKKLHDRFVIESDTLFLNMENCQLNQEKYNQLSTIYDSITMVYTREITKQLN